MWGVGWGCQGQSSCGLGRGRGRGLGVRVGEVRTRPKPEPPWSGRLGLGLASGSLPLGLRHSACKCLGPKGQSPGPEIGPRLRIGASAHRLKITSGSDSAQGAWLWFWGFALWLWSLALGAWGLALSSLPLELRLSAPEPSQSPEPSPRELRLGRLRPGRGSKLERAEQGGEQAPWFCPTSLAHPRRLWPSETRALRYR